MTSLFPDINAHPGLYRGLAKDELLVTKIFYTIQGEGPFAGYPAVFVRLAGCNRGQKTDMGCAFCDTNFLFNEGQVLTFDAIVAQIREKSHRALVVITGGEPFMQDNLVPFLTVLDSEGFTVQIETNGDRLSNLASNTTEVTVVVSPKVVRNGYQLLSINIAQYASCLKYLIEDDPKSPYYNVPLDALGWHARSKRPLYISPITAYARAPEQDEIASFWDSSLIDKVQTARNYRRAAELAMSYNLLVSIQKHLLLNIP